MHDLVSHGVDLKKRELSAQLAGAPLPPPLGCLIFTCNGECGAWRASAIRSRRAGGIVHLLLPVPWLSCLGCTLVRAGGSSRLCPAPALFFAAQVVHAMLSKRH